jgi:hypothetical protein
MPGTSVLPQAGWIDAHILRTETIDKLQIAAKDCHGACTKIFGQEGSRNEWNTRTEKPASMCAELGLARWYRQHFKRPGVRMGGVCQALCAYWIAFHATDRDFWGWLTTPQGYMRVDVAKTIIASQLASYGDETFENRSRWERSFLGAFGVIPQAAGRWYEQDLSKVTGEIRGQIISRALGSPQARWGYRSIGLYRPVGHCLAAWVGKDVTFFDPLYGEYWFEDRANFARWFREYWRMSGSGFKHSYFDITPYGKSVGSNLASNSWI